MQTKGVPSSDAKPAYSNGKLLAQQVLLETMAAIDLRRVMPAKLKLHGDTLVAGEAAIHLSQPPRVIAFGKAASRMAKALDAILGGRIEAGVVVSPAEVQNKLDRYRYFVGGHPYPTIGSLEGARAALELVSDLSAEDTVIFLISGGGSSLFELPIAPEIGINDLVQFNRLLVTSALPIEQINVLRKHISAVKGGRLGTCAWPATQLTVYVSDVPEQFPSMVSSGPTMPDESTVAECYALAEQHGLAAKFPASIRKHFEQRTLAETPKPGDSRFSKSHFFCALSNRDAVAAAKQAAEKLGFVTEVDPGIWDADFRNVAEGNLTALDELRKRNANSPVALIVGGEVTCPVTGQGVGGRNQAFVLYAAERIAGQPRVVVSAGTDGRDGNSPSAGAVADGHTIARARDHGFDPEQYLAESDSYHFFCSLGDTVEIGFTDNNVRDIRVWLDFG